jgi:CheY-like chemotaxis protein
VAKILVADDNSNIQKMVGLALKDHGIEVVAVGNGEAAVRKIADIRPDLVLADVFMPVRNGYEVCEYVKSDTSLAHIPVILLVGAFDPLDEQEAQRVGADGVLKKPFVPPDPLISMVKSALVRAGVAHAGFAPAKPVPEVPVEIPAAATPPSRNFAPKPGATLPNFDTESFVEEVPARPAALHIASGQQPVAFGSLLETPGTATEEQPSEVTAIPALDRDWRAAEVDEEVEEEDADAKPSWRRDAGREESAEPEKEVAARDGGWREPGPGDSHGLRNRHSGWAPTHEKADLTEAAEAPENVHTGISDFRNIPAVPFSGEAWAAAIEAGAQNKTAVAEEEHPTPHAAELEAMVGHAEESSPAVVEEESFVSESVRVPESTPVEEPAVVSAVVAEPGKASVTPSWFSTPPSPWDAEAQKATRLASTWDAIVAPAISHAPAPELTETNNSFATPAAPDEIEVVSASEPTSVITPEIDIEAIAARVLAGMSPDRLQEVARELLKPAIEAIIREELNKKS